jgi:hypothetical protein
VRRTGKYASAQFFAFLDLEQNCSFLNAEDGLITKASHGVEDDDDLAFPEKFEMLGGAFELVGI